MNKSIKAIVLDGFHKGHCLMIPYSPILRLLKPQNITVDYCCNGEESPLEKSEILEYKECFRAVDKNIVLYSEKGESEIFIGQLPWQTTTKPWTKETTLYFGYHNELLKRTDENISKKLNYNEKNKLKKLNNVIQVCDCGKVDAYKNDGHDCSRVEEN